MAGKPGARRRKKGAAAAGSVGLEPKAVSAGIESAPKEVRDLAESVSADGGAPVAAYRDPLGGRWLLLAALPLEKVSPTKFQRDLSETHVARLANVISKTGRFLDPIIAMREGPGAYLTPNGHHRLGALRSLGAKTITALLVPEPEVAYQILALNVEKAHNLREKSLEVIRMYRALAGLDGRGGRDESSYALEFEEAAFATLGACYEKKGRFAGGAYHSLLRRVDSFLDQKLPKALKVREERADALLALDETVVALVEALRKKGMQSPYLRVFVVARLNPLRFRRGATMEFDACIARMAAEAKKFDPEKIRPQDLAGAAGPPEAAE
ncbi:MAG: ParB N-terminal domain-containing protein [Planctomycetales bacterium]|nr:ParB N-terminal domain-containing protein [Planctomycetales bacterium]